MTTEVQMLDDKAAGWQALTGVHRRFHAMVKPIGSACNLNCAYCYYLSKEQLLGQQPGRRISDELLEKYIRQYIAGQDGNEIIFSWQGGEPTLLGLDFFQKVIDLQQKYQPSHQWIENDLQTNGTLLTDEWCQFLRHHNFLIGLSIDGPKELHDQYRVSKSGQPTFDKVMGAVKLLRKHGLRFNTLTVINRLSARRPLDVYRFLRREIGSTYIQLIPCVEPRDFRTTAPQHGDASKRPLMGSVAARPGSAESAVTDWSVDPDDWGDFLCQCFDEWYSQDVGRVQVNLFETAVAQTLGQPAQICTTHDFCGKGVAVEHDGSVYACDHFVYSEYCLGNIRERSISSMVFSERQKVFGFAKSKALPRQCRECPHLNLCWGECPKNRLIRTSDGEPGLNYLCSGLHKFFTHAQPYLNELAGQIEKKG